MSAEAEEGREHIAPCPHNPRDVSKGVCKCGEKATLGRYLVTERTWVTAASEESAIDAAVNCRKGYDQDVDSQQAVLVEEV